MSPVGLSGYFGYGNFGDEWFVAVWREWLAPGRARPLHPWSDTADVQAVVIGGGDILFLPLVNNNFWRPDLFRHPIWIWGIGVPDGPSIGVPDGAQHREARRQYADFLRHPNVRGIAARDHESAAAIQEIAGDGVSVQTVEDICWAGLMPQDRMLPIGQDRPWIGLSVRPCYGMLHGHEHLDFIAAANRLGYGVLLLPLQSPAPRSIEDHSMHQDLWYRAHREIGDCACEIAPDCLYLSQRFALIRQLAGYVTMRYHGWIAGLRQRIPTVALSPTQDRKFRTLAATLGDASLAPRTPAEALSRVLKPEWSQLWEGARHKEAKSYAEMAAVIDEIKTEVGIFCDV